ncbi:MAG: DUF4974 domain-containing protein [Paludibacter sp.]|nr:MAG: DUF4974 domain-containing protein [Paludibacter sp.]
MRDRLYRAQPLTAISRNRSWKRVDHYFIQKKIRLMKSLSAYAAVLIVAFLFGNLVRPVLTVNHRPEQETRVSVPLGQMSEVTLYDGTEVWLNSGTTLRYTADFGAKDRTVNLDGEAFFKVKHSNIPFRVKLRNSEIEVMGTSFNVVSYPEERLSTVTLVEGSVRINNSDGKEMLTMTPSQQAVIPGNPENIQVSTVNPAFFHSWTEGKIVFEEERLADVAVQLERWYNVEIGFKGKDVADLRFTGTILKNKPIDQSIRAFQLLLPVEIVYRNHMQEKDKITISKQDAPMEH